MKVVLINPPSPFLENDKANPPLGLLYIGTVLEKNNVDVSIIELAGLQEKDWKFVEADIFGIGFVTSQYPLTKRIVKILRERFPESMIVAGGPHPTVMPYDTLKIFDTVVIGEGERAIIDVIENLKKGIVQKPFIKNLDEIPFPNRKFIDIFSYTPDIDRYDGSNFSTTAISSRGCPFHCAYCCKTMWGHKVRFRSPENFVAELKSVVEEFGINHFKFLDETFTLDRKRTIKICELLKNQEIYWRCETRVDTVNYELFKKMYEGGCREVAFGIESGSQIILDRIRKGTTVELNKRAIIDAKKAGLKTKAFIMIGTPGETRETVEETKKFISEVKPDKWMVNTFIPTPGSDVWNHPNEFGIKILSKDFENYYFIGKGRKGGLLVETETLKPEDIACLRKELDNFIKETVEEQKQKDSK